MGKYSKPGAKVKEGGNFRKDNTNVTNGIPKLMFIPNFIRIGEWESVQNWQGKG